MTRILSLTTTAWRSFYQSQMAALEYAGIEVTTLPVPGEHRALEDDVRRRTPADYVRYLPQVLREARGEYDLVHANYGLTAPFAVAASMLPTADLPVVCTLWGGEYRDNQFEPLIRRATAHADHVIVPSKAMADRVDRPCDVIPFPVDTDLFRPIPTATAREHVGWDSTETNAGAETETKTEGEREQERIVLFPYAPSRDEKNYPLAKRVVDDLRDELDYPISLRTVANQPYEEMPYYLNAADAVLLTSRFESGPMTIKEATACNTPVVSRDVGFAREVLTDVSNAAVASDDAALRTHLAALLETGESADGRTTFTDYTVETMGSRLRTVYEQCLRETEPAQ
ncbi:glycosyltransferase family 4 protein [Natrialba sp. PRR66]|uniref:glycosyltransferase family 4 protein n=1 Tax=Natrialba sp. PRR66 TaxID=3098146 RepID=UPI002B1D6FDC|nr:glycosyltransferase family 4 protein [Natrialba sp. PRR66]